MFFLDGEEVIFRRRRERLDVFGLLFGHVSLKSRYNNAHAFAPRLRKEARHQRVLHARQPLAAVLRGAAPHPLAHGRTGASEIVTCRRS